jgi:hypothetical protein
LYRVSGLLTQGANSEREEGARGAPCLSAARADAGSGKRMERLGGYAHRNVGRKEPAPIGWRIGLRRSSRFRFEKLGPVHTGGTPGEGRAVSLAWERTQYIPRIWPNPTWDFSPQWDSKTPTFSPRYHPRDPITSVDPSYLARRYHPAKVPRVLRWG